MPTRSPRARDASRPQRPPARSCSVLGAAPGVAISQGEPDFDIPNGRFFTQTGGGNGRGFAVTDEGGVRFWSEFQRLGGVQAVGYPASQRFQWDGFTVQVFQRVVFQWRPEASQAYFVNVFDRLHDLGLDPWLLQTRQTPPPARLRRRGEVLGAGAAEPPGGDGRLPGHPGQRTSAWWATLSRPTGSPSRTWWTWATTSPCASQRVVFQEWKEDVPWAQRGTVTVALGGDIAKEAGILPDPVALQPTLPGGPQQDLQGR